MARRKSSRRGSKIQPAVMTLTFATPSVGGGATGRSYIDLSQVASLVNRRFYRQGINWAVGGFKVTSLQPGQVNIGKLPNTWVMSNAWEKSFRAWQQMIKNATDESGTESIKGKFLDFKIYANRQHHQDGFGDNLLPVDSLGNTANAGQWQASDITIPSTTGSPGSATDYELIAVGANNPGAGPSGKDAKSIIQGYADSRALPYEEDPNVPDDANSNWMVAMFNDGTLQDNAVIGMLEGTGDQAPYPYEDDGTNTDTMYPGGETNLPALQTHSVDFITTTTVGGTTTAKGGNFPCGLIELNCTNTARSAANLVVEINLVPGTHRGYLCEPMTEM